MKLESYVSGQWCVGQQEGRPLVNPVTGDEIARADASGLDIEGGLAFAREKGGAALATLSFAERGALLSAIANVLIANRDKYEDFARLNSGNTKLDAAIDIDGGIGTLKYYARLAKGLGDARSFYEADRDQLARDPVFFGQHIWTRRPGVAVQVNAFNFPSWGLWEKVATAMIAGVPSFAKPATATALVSYEMVRDVVASGCLPEGVLSLVCGSGEALLDHLRPEDSLAFTGSADTAHMMRAHPTVLAQSPRLNIEADSVNATVLGPDAAPGTVVFDLAVREATKALSVKAGQLCTNIRRIFVDTRYADDFSDAVAQKLTALRVGDPADEATRVGPLINLAQRKDAEEKLGLLRAECREVASAALPDCAPNSGFVAPTLLRCDAPKDARAVHDVEVFGPCATVLPYQDFAEATSLVAAAQGSLAMSLFTNDQDIQIAAVTQLGAWNGRILCVDEEVGKAHTGHSIVMPQCMHGGPGRAGGGEELGGVRGLRFHMQRTAIQGGAGLLDRLQETAIPGAL